MKHYVRSFILLTALTVHSVCITIDQVEQEHSTIIERNHFYSNYEINTTYQINKVDTAKPIILFLKKKDDNAIFDNNVTIGLVSGDKKANCLFNSFDKMCYLNNLPTGDMSLTIRCDHLPCEVSWTILQPAMKTVQEQQEARDLFDISESSHHMIAVVTCNNPEITDFHRKVQAYSENDFIHGYTDEIVYYLFSKEK